MFNLEGTMMGSAYMSLAVLRDWVILRQLWPAIIRAQHTEKPAIQATIDKIIKRIEQNFETLHFEFKVSELYLPGDVYCLDCSDSISSKILASFV